MQCVSDENGKNRNVDFYENRRNEAGCYGNGESGGCYGNKESGGCYGNKERHKPGARHLTSSQSDIDNCTVGDDGEQYRTSSRVSDIFIVLVLHPILAIEFFLHLRKYDMVK